jgi:hypothetical protein
MAPWAHLTLTNTTGSNRDCRFQRASQGDNTMSFSGARTSHRVGLEAPYFSAGRKAS